MNILRKKLNSGVVIFDGAMGTELYKRNFFVNNSYEQLNVTGPAVISEIHRAYPGRFAVTEISKIQSSSPTIFLISSPTSASFAKSNNPLTSAPG